MSSSQPNLQVSSTTAYMPAIVGFILTGIDIKTYKMWHFGEKVVGPVHDLVYNYYDFSEDTYAVYVEVGTIGPGGKFSRTGISNTVTINVHPRKPEFNVYQTEAIIYKGNFIGLAVSTKLTGDQEHYVSGDGQELPWKPMQLNPWFKYEKGKPSPYTGKVDISGNEVRADGIEQKYVGYQEFNVLVYSDEIIGTITVQPMQADDPSLPDGVHQTKNELKFLVDVNELPTEIISASWNFGDGGPEKHGKLIPYRYQSSGNYLAKCTIKVRAENTESSLTLYKTVIIRDPIR